MTDLVLPETDASISLARPDLNPVRVYLAGLKSPRSRATMRDGLLRCAAVMAQSSPPADIEQIPWAAMGFAHTDALRAALIARYQPSTVRVTLAALRGVLRTSWRLELMSHEDFARATDWRKLGGVRLPAGRDLPPRELDALRAYCRAEDPPYREFLCAVFALLVGAGLRGSELGGLALDNFDAERGYLRFVRKGDKEVQIGLGDTEAFDLSAWLRVRRLSGPRTRWMFPRVLRSGAWKPTPITLRGLEHLCVDVAYRAGIPHFSPHDCRRTFCTRMLDEGVDLAVVQRLMSHASPETTVRYDRRQDLADAEARRKVVIW